MEGHDSKVEAVAVAERVAVHTCLEEACVGVESAVVGNLGPREQNMMQGGRAAKSSHQAFATDMHVSDSLSSWQLLDAITPEVLQGRRSY